MKSFKPYKDALEKAGAVVKIVAPHGGNINCNQDMKHIVAAAIMTTESVLFDALLIPGGDESVKSLLKTAKFTKFIREAYKHCKAIAALGAGEKLLKNAGLPDYKKDKAVFIEAKPQKFIEGIAQHRNWERMEQTDAIAV